jgi:mannose-6-phosphate isomerase
MPLYPLKFRPRFVEKIWGGRKIQTELGKELPAGKLIGESWELYDFPPGVVDGSNQWVSAVIDNGPLAGRTLHDAVVEYGRDLHGDIALAGTQGQFPILIKFLDARQDLSLQVHPDQAYAQAHPDAHLKSEAWYIVQRDPDAAIYKGLRKGVTRPTLAGACADGAVMDHVHRIPVKAGDCHYLPSGTVHALGAGILVAEVQTPSDTTFRLFDFNRLDDRTGRPRDLHVEQALACIDFDATDGPQRREHAAGLMTTVSRLVDCPWFTLEKVRFIEGVEQAIPYDQPVVWIMLEGAAHIATADGNPPVPVARGDTVLLPARMNKPRVQTHSNCVWLEVTFIK